MGYNAQQILQMAEQQESFNYEVADIYQSMLNGDKNALYKLQQINVMNHLPRFHPHPAPHKNKVNTQEHIDNQEEHQLIESNYQNRESAQMKVSSVANISRKKEQMYMNVIRRGAKMGALSKNQLPDNHHKVKRLVNSSQREPQKDLKESKLKPKYAKEDKPQVDLSVQLKTNHTVDFHLPKQSKIYALPKVPKPKQAIKVQSAQVTGSKKNTSQYQSEKVKTKHKQGQKLDFKELIGKSKQERYDFDKKNEQQRKAQIQLMEYHRSTKDFLENIKEKHNLNCKNKKKFLKRNKTEERSHLHSLDISQTNNSEKMSPFKQEKHKCQDIISEINHLKIQYNKNSVILSNIEKYISNLPFQRYLDNRDHSVSQISEEEEDEVEPLETAEQIKNKYRHLMAHTKDRKWGLMQRTQYEAQRTQSLGQSRRTGESRLTQGEYKMHQTNGQQNKMVINERLKNLLFT